MPRRRWQQGVQNKRAAHARARRLRNALRIGEMGSLCAKTVAKLPGAAIGHSRRPTLSV
jgi:hypothetical protein